MELISFPPNKFPFYWEVNILFIHYLYKLEAYINLII